MIELRLKIRGTALATAALATLVGAAGCSAPLAKDASPEEKLASAKRSLQRRQYETAMTALEQIRDVTAGTKLGGDVLFAMAETKFAMGDYAEADGLGETYLDLFPTGPSAPEALYLRARANLRMVEKTRVGLFRFERYIPHDRDRAPIARARELFTLYVQKHPGGVHATEAVEAAVLLTDREAEHELEVASFYLKRGRAAAALTRTQAVLESGCSQGVKAAAEDLAARARNASSEDTGGQAP